MAKKKTEKKQIRSHQEGLQALGECMNNASTLLEHEECKELFKTTIFELEKLPDIVLMNLLPYLGPKSSGYLCQVSKRFKRICTSINFTRYWTSEVDKLGYEEKIGYKPRIKNMHKLYTILKKLENVYGDRTINNILMEAEINNDNELIPILLDIRDYMHTVTNHVNNIEEY